jgi:hypothetical protein
VGTRQAVIEIDNEKANLQFCKHCIEAAYRNKNRAFKNSGNNNSRQKNHFQSIDIPKDNERVNKVTYYMFSYPKAEVVQVYSLLFIGHFFFTIIDIFLYLCLFGWSIWKHMVQIFQHPSFVICISKHHHYHHHR